MLVTMENIKEVWVNAVLMPNGEIICDGKTLGWLSRPTSSGSIPERYVCRADDYKLVPKRKGV
jgi:hypothetical protein